MTTSSTSTSERAGEAICALVYTALDLSGTALGEQRALRLEAMAAANAVLETSNITGRFLGAVLQQGSLLVVLEAEAAGSSHDDTACRLVAALNETVVTTPAALAIGASRTLPDRLSSPHLCMPPPPPPPTWTDNGGAGEREVGGEENRESTSSSWLLAAMVLLVLLALATLVVISYKKTWIIYSADITPPPRASEPAGGREQARASDLRFKSTLADPNHPGLQGDDDVIELFTTQQTFESQGSVGGAGLARSAATSAPQYVFGSAGAGDVDVDTGETTMPTTCAHAKGQPMNYSLAAMDAAEVHDGLRLEQPVHYFEAAVDTVDVNQPNHYFQAAVDTGIDDAVAALNHGVLRMELTRGRRRGEPTPQRVYDVASDRVPSSFGAAESSSIAATTCDAAAPTSVGANYDAAVPDAAKHRGDAAAYDAANNTGQPPGANATYNEAEPSPYLVPVVSTHSRTARGDPRLHAPHYEVIPDVNNTYAVVGDGGQLPGMSFATQFSSASQVARIWSDDELTEALGRQTSNV